MPKAQKIIIIADDLSGAAEVAGIAFSRGLSAEVQRQFDPAANASLIALDTDSRQLSSADAASRLHQIATQISAARPDWLFKKTDSVLRGNVRAEIEALLKISGRPRALLIPANPSRGRTIRAGRYFIDGLPLDQTPFAHDPDHPRQSADIAALLASAGDFPVHAIAANAPLPATGISVPDIETAADLIHFASALDDATLPAGAADFFSALLHDREPISPHDNRLATPSANVPTEITPQPLSVTPPALLVCGSPAAWPTRCDQCRAANIHLATIDQPPREIPVSGVLLLGIGDSLPHQSVAAPLARLADLTAAVLQASSATSLLAEGGATAAAIADRLGWTRFTVVAAAPAGVGILQPLAPNAPLFIIKPGSYPWPPEIWRAFCDARR